MTKLIGDDKHHEEGRSAYEDYRRPFFIRPWRR